MSNLTEERQEILEPRRTPLKVALLGYYNRQNYGDDLLQASIVRMFSHHAVNVMGWTPRFNSLNDADLVLIGGGSIWPDHAFFSREGSWFNHVNVPFAVLGISSKRVDASAAKSLHRLVDAAIYFHVRDRDTYEALGKSEKVRCGSDLFWWTTPRPASMPCRQKMSGQFSIGLNLREWKSAEWSPRAVATEVARCCDSVVPFPLYFGSPVHDQNIDRNDEQLLISLGFDNVPSDVEKSRLNCCSAVVSMRFHGLLLAISSGIPCIGFSFHPKMISLFNLVGAKELCVPLNDIGALSDALRRLKDEYAYYESLFAVAKQAMLETAVDDRNLFFDVIRNRCF